MKLSSQWQQPESIKQAFHFFQMLCSCNSSKESNNNLDQEAISQKIPEILSHPEWHLNQRWLYQKLTTLLLNFPPDSLEWLIDYSPPSYLKKTTEGSLLFWAITQKQQLGHSPPAMLLSPSVPAASLAELTARVWFCWWQNPEITAHNQSLLVQWSEAYPASHKWLLRIFLAQNHLDKAISLAQLWLQREDWKGEFVFPALRECLENAEPQIKKLGQKGFRSLLLNSLDSSSRFFRCCEIAQQFSLYRELLWGVKLLQQRESWFSQEMLSELLVHIWIGLEQPETALEEYRRELLGKPYGISLTPEILRVAIDYQEGEIQAHLLANYSVGDLKLLPEQTAWRWVAIEKLHADEKFAQAQGEWEQLWEDTQEIYYLQRWTLCLLECPYGVFRNHYEKVIGLWEEMLQQTSRVLAASALTVIAGHIHAYQQVVEYYREFLAQEPLDNFWTSKAAHHYIIALGWLDYWGEIGDVFEREDHFGLGMVTSWEEYYFFYHMARLHRLYPREELHWKEWFYQWERILQLPLTTEKVALVVKQFIELEQEQQQALKESSTREKYYRDLRLRMEGFARSRAEDIYREKSLSFSKQEEYREVLAGRGLDTLPKLLLDLIKE